MPINIRLNAHEIAYILDHAETKVLLVDASLWAEQASMLKERKMLQVVIVDQLASFEPYEENQKIHASRGKHGNHEIHANHETHANQKRHEKHDTQTDYERHRDHEEHGQRLQDYETLIRDASSSPHPLGVRDEWDMISIHYTSGTTGRPKGVMLHHRGAYLNALAEVIETGMRSEDVYLWTLPMFHAAGWGFPWAVTAIGGKHVLLPKVEPAEIVRFIEVEGVTHLSAAPTVLTMIAQYLQEKKAVLPKPVHVITAAAPPSPALLRRMEEIGATVTHVYGLTEVYGPFAVNVWRKQWDSLPLHERARLKARQGVPYVGLGELMVVDAEMAPVSQDGRTMGEVVMRGNGVMLGYYKNEEETDVAFRGGWFHTGDYGVWHEDGYIELMDRKKDIIISGGENISSIEVEKTLLEHPAVLEVAVIGIPDERWGEVPRAYVTLKPGYDVHATELIQFCRERIAHFKCPKDIVFGSLPKTSTGKIQKYVLREQAWQGQEKKIHG